MHQLIKFSVRVGALFWIDPSLGHNILCSLYLRYCGNKSVAGKFTVGLHCTTYYNSEILPLV